MVVGLCVTAFCIFILLCIFLKNLHDECSREQRIVLYSVLSICAVLILLLIYDGLWKICVSL